MVEKDTPDMLELMETTMCSTFSQIFVDGVFIGGLPELKTTTLESV